LGWGGGGWVGGGVARARGRRSGADGGRVVRRGTDAITGRTATDSAKSGGAGGTAIITNVE